MAEEDVVTVEDHTVLDEEDIENPYPDPSASEFLSHPDQSTSARKTDQYQMAIRDKVVESAEYYNDEKNASVRVNTNQSGAVQFRRIALSANPPPVMIVKEKRNRGRVIIRCYDPGNGTPKTVFIGTDISTSVGGSNTIQVTCASDGRYERVIRTTMALWAIADGDTVIDIVEEFD